MKAPPSGPRFDGWAEARRLIEFGRGARAEIGFGALDRYGRLGAEAGSDLVITARMTYCFSIGALIGWPGCAELAAHGVDALGGPFHDQEHGGYFRALPPVETADLTAGGRKAAYQHAFVVLSAATAAAAGISGAGSLLDDALSIMERRFWSDHDRALIESWDRSFRSAEPYWGANANMHGVEALLAVYAQTADETWRDRALAIADTFINRYARAADWLLPEHFGLDWRVDHDYNSDRRADEFRPYGVTPGHLLEWSRLLLELRSTFLEPPGWLIEAARRLYDTAFDRGWWADGTAGFVYTIDRAGRPVVRTRPHWVLAEAIGASATWHHLSREPVFRERLSLVINYAERFLIDHDHGSWHHELGPDNRPAGTMWGGKPDIYHALQASLLTELPLGPSLAARLIERKDPCPATETAAPHP